MAARPTDPENLYHCGRQFALLGADVQALHQLGRAVNAGYFCAESLEADPAFDAIRDRPHQRQSP